MGVPVATISSDGKDLDPKFELLSVVIHREVNRIPEATLILLDGSIAQRRFEISDLAFFLPGAPIAIALRSEGDPKATTVFNGLVIRHAVQRSGDRSTLQIELKDAAFALTRTRRSAVFRKQSDADVIRSVIKAAGLKAVKSGTIDSTTPQHDELVQYNATDWDFILCRADAVGLGVTVHRGEISAKKVALGTPRRALDNGLDDVSEISMEIDASRLWASVSGIGWDLTKGEATPPEPAVVPSLNVGNLNVASIAKAVGGNEEHLLHPAEFQPGELKDWASARLLRSRFAMQRGRVMLSGDASLEPLDTVDILGVGDRFNGKALVSAVTHTVDENGWQTELRLGLPPDPFASRPDLEDLPAGGLLPPLRGLQIATVASLAVDARNQFRVEVRLPALPGNQGHLWARLACPDAGDGRGFEFRPETGDEVVLGFLDDDPRQPVVLGSLHSARNPPPKPVENPSQSNDRRAVVSRAGTRIVFDDAAPSLTLETTAGGNAKGTYMNRIVIDEAASTISIKDQHGNDITLAQGGITLTSAKDITIKASGKVVIKGVSVDIQ